MKTFWMAKYYFQRHFSSLCSAFLKVYWGFMDASPVPSIPSKSAMFACECDDPHIMHWKSAQRKGYLLPSGKDGLEGFATST